MPDRAMKVRHLAQADRHLLEGQLRILVMEKNISLAMALNMDIKQPMALLAVTVELLASCKAHRLLVLQALKDLDGCDGPSVGAV